MITKKQLLDSLLHELHVVKHLTSKLTPEMMDYRPAPGMRSTLELLHYLCCVGAGATKSIANNNWEIFSAYSAEAKNFTLKDIPAALDRQAQDLKDAFAEISEDKFTNFDVTYPWGGGDKLGMAVINTSLKFLTAYKLQLFVYAKSCGLTKLNTANAWGGIDMEMPAPK
ncbi:MAG: hypothetical protein U0136_21040 [Bdellovibrionota bacterium]